MESENRHYDAWELIHDDKIILAKELMKKLNADEVFRQIVRKRSNERSDYLLCRHCNTKIHYKEPSAARQQVTLSHNSKGKNLEKHQAHVDCPFCTTGDSTILSQFYKGEGVWHQTTKLGIVSVLNSDPFCLPGTAIPEKYYFGKTPNTRRCPDVQFTDINGKLWALELTNHWMNPEIAVQREQFFLENGFNLIWIMSPNSAENRNAMYRFTMFGLAGDTKGSDREYGHFNAFVMTEEMMALSRQSGELHLLVEFPVFLPNTDTDSIEYQLESRIIKLNELSRIQGNPIPYIQDQCENYINSKNGVESAIKSKEDKALNAINLIKIELPHAIDNVNNSIDTITIENKNSNYDVPTQLDERVNHLQNLIHKSKGLIAGTGLFLPHEISSAEEYVNSIDLKVVRKVRSLQLAELALIDKNLPELTERIEKTVKDYAGEESDKKLDDAENELKEALVSAKQYAKLFNQFDSRNISLAEQSLDLVRPKINEKRQRIRYERELEKKLILAKENKKQSELKQQRYSKLSNDIDNFIQEIKNVKIISEVPNYHFKFEHIVTEANSFSVKEAEQLLMSLRLPDRNIMFRSYLWKFQQLRQELNYSLSYQPLLLEVFNILNGNSVFEGISDRHLLLVNDGIKEYLNEFEDTIVHETIIANELDLSFEQIKKLIKINKFLISKGYLQKGDVYQNKVCDLELAANFKYQI